MRVTLFRDLPEEGWPSMEVYADQLAAALERLGEPGLVVQTFPPKGRSIPLAGWGGMVGLYLRRSLLYPLQARRAQGDINHVGDHSYGHLLHFLDTRRTTVTCHDLTPLVLRHTLPCPSLGLALWDWAFRGMLKAARIIAVSENTRRDLVRYGAKPAKIAVIYEGVDPAFHPITDNEILNQTRARYRLPSSPLVLHVGHCGLRKNIKGLLQALARLKNWGYRMHLVQIGGRFTADQRALINYLDLAEAVTQIESVPDSELPVLYNLADLFVFPSLYEGFGFPPLEAMACGTPVICSNAASLPEVVGDAALAVVPDNTEGLAAAIRRVLDDCALAEDLRRSGLKRARQFTWERTAQETLKTYHQILEEIA